MGKLSIIIQSVLGEIADCVEFILRDFPGKSGYLLRWLYYKCRMKRLGRHVAIGPGCRIKGCKYISIDDNSVLALNCMLLAGPVDTARENGCEYLVRPNPHFEHQSGDVVIGKGVYLSRNCYILGNGGVQIDDFCCCSMDVNIISMSNHYASFKEPGNRNIYFTHCVGPDHECYLLSPVVLKKNVGIASKCTLLPGASILEDSFLGVNSVVYRAAIGPNQVASGNPAVFIKDRYTDKGKQQQ